jgi:Holliday junction resolvase
MEGRAVTEQSKAIVDIVCDVCRAEGFSVIKNSSDASRETPTVDIVASRKDGGNTRTLAFECWQGEREVNGKQVENFVQRIHALSLGGGVYVSSRGFTGDAEFMARKLGVELWDIPKLKEHLARITPQETASVPWTLPVSKQVASKAFTSKLENGTALRMTALPRLEFRPYIFVRFTVSTSMHRAMAVLVLDGVDGRACDAKLLEGQIARLSPTGFFSECLDLEPLTGWMPQLSDGLEMKDSVTVAELGITPENLEERISEQIQAETGLPPGGFTVNEATLLHVPILTLELGAGGKVYRRIVQAATARMIWDDSARCSYCDLGSNALCETCWFTVCSKHERLCSRCGRPVCSNCATSKGIRGKTFLCPSCRGH